ncbi:acyl-CoA dehydrogenase family protein [Rhodoplanes sp. TEM]|uniref:Acyl-CoA dehydrogenase family protein n=1 Tax=Rhodoplanes tepidamans TaxID=200616 RepID=A0ABT5J673_RHOTP|nr:MULTISPECIES: acyl-CoA dehydrogenase family protein [Rhodoplanes]MDC7784881.1 acyl-CoA dehydrogenase family protein [Rhodoplanes tepidamans]MDC7986067.1 acyl-CoA dehydrogenase family protein [Rhodoplanes sp. TEM]MDQ0353890.1 glutaryl-CoA dehydrogenase (non-decarboxylating) [Rhodoplanes tepidamans]
MHFDLNDEQRMVQETARRFALEDIAPTLVEEEKAHAFKPERVARMGELGFFGCALPEELGGTGLGFLESVLMAEQVAKISASWRLPFNMQNLGPALTVTKFGTPEQKQKYVPGWVAGTRLGFFAMTEPNTGSDVASMKTHAIDKGDHWEVHGTKMWISQAHVGDAGLLYAYTDRSAGNRGMTAFIIEPKAWAGVSARPIETKLGLHCAPTGEFVFDGMKVPKENVLGTPGDGFRICMWQLNQTRLGCAAGALGVAGGCLDLAVDYANGRTQFGKPISQHQMVQAQIADMVAEHQAAQMLVYRAAWLKDQGKPSQYETSVAKLFASEAAVHAANECMKIFGSYGFSTEYPAERFYRDAKSLQIVEGTSNIQRMIIAGMACGFTPNRE